MKTKSESSQQAYRRQAEICKAFANPTRLHLLALLNRGSRWSSDLQANLGISKANLSQHLAILKAAGVVQTHREGRRLRCGLSTPAVSRTTALLRHVMKSQALARHRLV